MSEALLNRELVSVELTQSEPRRYDIVIQPHLLDRLGEECLQFLAKDSKILVLTDTHVAGLYLEPALQSLRAAGFTVTDCVIPAGEVSKSLSQAEQVYAMAAQLTLSRKDAILGLGGGVIGDLAGFCASTWHRGMQLIHVPTTLVAQVDSAIGGKTAVNLGHVKNMVGTFYQPKAVLADSETLKTLPPRELSAGLAEVVKYGLIETSCTGETGFFDWLVAHSKKWMDHLPEIIQCCAHIKATVVMQDELETRGLRHFLNLGHTFGHAYESLSEYGILHGEAVGIGLVQATRLSVQLGLLPQSVYDALLPLLDDVGLGASVAKQTDFPAESLLAAMRQDKKNLGSQIRLILPTTAAGQVVTRTDISDAQILKILGGQ